MEGQAFAGLTLVVGAVGGFILGAALVSPRKRNDSIHYTLNEIKMSLQDLKVEIDGLKGEVATLQASVDAEQAQIAALLETNATVVNSLNEQIDTLETQLAEAQDPTVLQEAIDGLKEIRQSIVTAKEDIGGTVADAPIEPTDPTI